MGSNWRFAKLLCGLFSTARNTIESVVWKQHYRSLRSQQRQLSKNAWVRAISITEKRRRKFDCCQSNNRRSIVNKVGTPTSSIREYLQSNYGNDGSVLWNKCVAVPTNIAPSIVHYGSLTAMDFVLYSSASLLQKLNSIQCGSVTSYLWNKGEGR